MYKNFAGGQIPDATTIHQIRKQRQMARDTGDFLPLDDTVKYENSSSRLVRYKLLSNFFFIQASKAMHKFLYLLHPQCRSVFNFSLVILVFPVFTYYHGYLLLSFEVCIGL